MERFQIATTLSPKGDQPQAIEALASGLGAGKRFQTLLGVTGSGKTFTIANMLARLNRPTLVVSHNKTLAAQLYEEFKEFFPDNAVEYFVSYYDYYQPEAYVPQSDTYISKESSRNKRLDEMRLSATQSLLTRRDVIVVASVSCIYGLGDPNEYKAFNLVVKKGETVDRQAILRRLVDMQYARNEYDLPPGGFRARGDTIEVASAEGDTVYRIELFGDEVDALSRIDPLTGDVQETMEGLVLYPAKHFVATGETLNRVTKDVEAELATRLDELRGAGKLLEAQRLEQRTRFDLDMLAEMGYCNGIENYSRHFTGRKPGEPPYTLLDYFPDDFVTVIDESHVTVPQLRGMYNGDRSRKEVLVQYGFRLESALDNRPLRFEEFLERVGQVVFVSATPGPFEAKSSENVVEQLVRPTGLVDPTIVVKPARNQVDDLLGEIKKRIAAKERVLVTTLTKRMAEDLTEYYASHGLRVRYMHSDIDTLARIDLLEDLRLGAFDVLVGINLLREGLDLPEVSLVAILDADKEGYLRSETSLIQTFGRAARNVNGTVICYAEKRTPSLAGAIRESERRRLVQEAFNKKHGITPTTIVKTIRSMRLEEERAIDVEEATPDAQIERLEAKMLLAAKRLDFERAAKLRDRVRALRRLQGERLDAS